MPCHRWRPRPRQSPRPATKPSEERCTHSAERSAPAPQPDPAARSAQRAAGLVSSARTTRDWGHRISQRDRDRVISTGCPSVVAELILDKINPSTPGGHFGVTTLAKPPETRWIQAKWRHSCIPAALPVVDNCPDAASVLRGRASRAISSAAELPRQRARRWTRWQVLFCQSCRRPTRPTEVARRRRRCWVVRIPDQSGAAATGAPALCAFPD